MVKKSSREIALERRKSLSTSGKKGSALSSSSPNRTRTAPRGVAKTTSDSSLKSKRSAKAGSHSARGSSRNIKSVANSSREISLARREALSRRGKIADNSTDRTRVDVVNASSTLQNNEAKKYQHSSP